MPFAVRTPSVSTVAWSRCRTSMNWAWWLPGTPGMPVSGMLVTVLEYFSSLLSSRSPSGSSRGGRTGLTRRAMNRRPRASSRPAHQAGARSRQR
jgi:hypothetical protein